LQRASDILTVRKPGRLSRIAAPVRANMPDKAWAAVLTVLGMTVFAVAAVIIVELWRLSSGLLARTGVLSFVVSSDWDVVRDLYGALPFIYGTLITSCVALVLALPVSVGLALFLTEMAP
jgi:phosphate transport system permease protein